MNLTFNGIDLGDVIAAGLTATPVIDPETGEVLWREVRLTVTLPPETEE